MDKFRSPKIAVAGVKKIQEYLKKKYILQKTNSILPWMLLNQWRKFNLQIKCSPFIVGIGFEVTISKKNLFLQLSEDIKIVIFKTLFRMLI